MYKRKYQKGKQITSLDELSKQTLVYFYDRPLHHGWFMSWQVRLAQHYVERGCLYKVEKVGDEM